MRFLSSPCHVLQAETSRRYDVRVRCACGWSQLVRSRSGAGGDKRVDQVKRVHMMGVRVSRRTRDERV